MTTAIIGSHIPHEPLPRRIGCSRAIVDFQTWANLRPALQLHGARIEGYRRGIYLTRAIAASDLLTVGSGHGPVHHFHALWTEDPAE